MYHVNDIHISVYNDTFRFYLSVCVPNSIYGAFNLEFHEKHGLSFFKNSEWSTLTHSFSIILDAWKIMQGEACTT